jgi:nucleotide-binding universal stress UspA family protein
MENLKKIMVAVDFSRYSKRVLEYAGVLAQRMKCKLVIVNVINNRDVDALQRAAQMTKEFSIDEWVKKQKEERLLLLRELMAEASVDHHPVKVLFRTGVPFRELMKAVEEETPDLLAMGPKGRTDLPDIRLGSTAEKAFRRCPVPILSIREDSD